MTRPQNDMTSMNDLAEGGQEMLRASFGVGRVVGIIVLIVGFVLVYLGFAILANLDPEYGSDDRVFGFAGIGAGVFALVIGGAHIWWARLGAKAFGPKEERNQ